MDRKMAKRLWRIGVVIFFLLAALRDCLNEMFLHTDRFMGYILDIYIFFWLPALFRREVDKRKGNIFLGVCCLLILSGTGISTVMYKKYKTEEVVMPVYGEYMVTSGKKDRVLISTRMWSARHHSYRTGESRHSPEYIYIMKKGTGTEENILHLLQRRYGAELMILYGNIVILNDVSIGNYYLTERDKFDLVILRGFEERPLPAS